MGKLAKESKPILLGLFHLLSVLKIQISVIIIINNKLRVQGPGREKSSRKEETEHLPNTHICPCLAPAACPTVSAVTLTFPVIVSLGGERELVLHFTEMERASQGDGITPGGHTSRCTPCWNPVTCNSKLESLLLQAAFWDSFSRTEDQGDNTQASEGSGSARQRTL